jgi:hypothetical protein
MLTSLFGAITEEERNINIESLYDYGARAGFWRLHRLFTKRKTPCTVFAVGMVRTLDWDCTEFSQTRLMKIVSYVLLLNS